MKPIDINVSSVSGQVLQFKYNAGTDPGSTRTVHVHDQDSRLIGGYDFMRESYRQFRVSHIENVRLLEVKDGAHEIDVDQLPTNLNMGYMRNAYEQDGFRVYQQTDGILIAVKKSLVEPPKPTVRFDRQGLTITGVGGEMNVRGGVSANARLTMNGVLVRSAATPADIISCLQQVVNG